MPEFNVERFDILIEAVKKKSPESFDMEYWRRDHNCGTTLCGAGSYAEECPDRFEFRLRTGYFQYGTYEIRRRSDNRTMATYDWSDEFGISKTESQLLFNAYNNCGISHGDYIDKLIAFKAQKLEEMQTA